MTNIYSLCSSSKGNATYIGDKNNGILIDAGIGIRNFTKRMSELEINDDALKAIFITHEHIDHIKGLKAIVRKYNVPVYASCQTLEALIEKECFLADADLNEICKGVVEIKEGFKISAYETPHDSANSQCYKIIHNDKKICVCTDLGYMADSVYENLKGSDFVLLESNYDEGMLTCGDYPYMLKRRIAGDRGHLSNNICAETLKRLFKDGTNKFMLGHLSENNNRPELAFQYAISALSELNAANEKDYSLSVAGVNAICQMVIA